jgi:hypothetical protein
MSDKVRMRYTGPGEANDIEVEENEVLHLEQTGLWTKSRSKKTLEESQEEEEGSDS